MSPQEKFLHLLENIEKVKGSDNDFLAQKDENHQLIPEEIERVERIYSELEEAGEPVVTRSIEVELIPVDDLIEEVETEDHANEVYGGLEDEIEVEEIENNEEIEETQEAPKKKSWFKFW